MPRVHQPAISAIEARKLISYNPVAGTFAWIAPRRGVRLGHPPGTRHPDGRLEIALGGRRHKAARIAWLLMTGEWPSSVIDHINGNPSDDRFENLRDVSTQANIQNQLRPQRSNQSSSKLGVTRRKNGKWQSRLVVGDKNTTVGTFDSEDEAYSAYVAAKRVAHVGCTL